MVVLSTIYLVLFAIAVVLVIAWAFLPLLLLNRMEKMHDEQIKTNAQLVRMTRLYLDNNNTKPAVPPAE